MAKPQEDMTTLMLSKGDRERLTALALSMGYLWGERGNATRLVEAIAHGEIPLNVGHWGKDRIEALLQARKALIDTGQTECAQELSRLLLERTELSPLGRAELESGLEKETFEVVTRLRSFIQMKQPFRLSYQDAAENLFEFRIRYAEIAFRERRQYLECWVEGAVGGLDVPELSANRTLRLDRIPDAAIVPLEDEPWRSEGLDTVVVELHLFNRLAHAYEPKSGDFKDEWANVGGQTVRKVWREVTNTFWLGREVFVHGADCLVVSPTNVSERLATQVEKMYARYENLLGNQH